MSTYLATFTPRTREPQVFMASDDGHAERMARQWHGFSELFRKTDIGYVRVAS